MTYVHWGDTVVMMSTLSSLEAPEVVMNIHGVSHICLYFSLRNSLRCLPCKLDSMLIVELRKKYVFVFVMTTKLASWQLPGFRCRCCFGRGGEPVNRVSRIELTVLLCFVLLCKYYSFWGFATWIYPYILQGCYVCPSNSSELCLPQ